MRLSCSTLCIFLLGGLILTTDCYRIKRSLNQFAMMIALTTERSAMEFSDYGNYCGFGGKGVPQDPIDQCCKEHDDCYDSVDNRLMKIYFNEYEWDIKNGTVHCADTDPLRLATCTCDRTAAYCFAHNLDYFDREQIGKFGSFMTKLMPGFMTTFKGK